MIGSGVTSPSSIMRMKRQVVSHPHPAVLRADDLAALHRQRHLREGHRRAAALDARQLPARRGGDSSVGSVPTPAWRPRARNRRRFRRSAPARRRPGPRPTDRRCASHRACRQLAAPRDQVEGDDRARSPAAPPAPSTGRGAASHDRRPLDPGATWAMLNTDPSPVDPASEQAQPLIGQVGGDREHLGRRDVHDLGVAADVAGGTDRFAVVAIGDAARCRCGRISEHWSGRPIEQ